MKYLVILAISVSICSYFLIKYIRLVLINSNCCGIKQSLNEISNLFREEPLFLIFYFGFIIFFFITGIGLVSLLNSF
ncbi:MAG: hypothetical protein A3C43_12490 [Candidatus Schekmanbacteria bacterium RIFCSPHIGHO2_02_FULL_38_11]|uniref:Uncharacterized protein n=1 Tax=Candidatus Schekmanbacteria bacterium RIFCSPLOWO2_12_FULL_38_15 TaxID=1817883 RepID=A0A1F7SHY2_9BACT|nr:MAG: hypothetical protein A2043_04135 [Candidatus Schekmanbacteria bacterium GWA2_38_9]OGL50838.1 MAG: hypothetical protein A3H37_03230 [Candidatus Schekmanbacteria bacterium RIFCSPLOWO2_02_FULL_38_14]OGL53402.1 MAG: hypothetical protein A3G31_07835 [Candidatus Schekmanbacteria bacterium RIFCSPLOWO2_12_FULL_38_15]OGL55754.1 MAG: hypothetical protein A3C43_12490 [Candidatus Schekmanbacteria bacterium RIFCSPHIGHO2_02_FULL_38_11]